MSDGPTFNNYGAVNNYGAGQAIGQQINNNYAPQPRTFKNRDMAALTAAAQKCEGTSVEIEVPANNHEAQAFGAELISLLVGAGWRVSYRELLGAAYGPGGPPPKGVILRGNGSEPPEWMKVVADMIVILGIDVYPVGNSETNEIIIGPAT